MTLATWGHDCPSENLGKGTETQHGHRSSVPRTSSPFPQRSSAWWAVASKEPASVAELRVQSDSLSGASLKESFHGFSFGLSP